MADNIVVTGSILNQYMSANILNGGALFNWKDGLSQTVWLTSEGFNGKIVFYVPVVVNYTGTIKPKDLTLINTSTGAKAFHPLDSWGYTSGVLLDENGQHIYNTKGLPYSLVKVVYNVTIPHNTTNNDITYNFNWSFPFNNTLILSSAFALTASDYTIRIKVKKPSYVTEDAVFETGGTIQPFSYNGDSIRKRLIAIYRNMFPSSISLTINKDNFNYVEPTDTPLLEIEEKSSTWGEIYANFGVKTNYTNKNLTFNLYLEGTSKTTGSTIKSTVQLTQLPNTIAYNVVYPEEILVDDEPQEYKFNIVWDKEEHELESLELVERAGDSSIATILSNKDYVNETGEVVLRIKRNETHEERTQYIYVTFKEPGSSLKTYAIILIRQSKGIYFGALPAWQTKNVRINSDKEKVRVDIYTGEDSDNKELIYSNTAYLANGIADIDVTEILNNKLDSDVVLRSADSDGVWWYTYQATDQMKKVYVYADDELIYKCKLIYNYEFTNVNSIYNSETLSLNRNLFYEIDPRQFVFSSVYVDEEGVDIDGTLYDEVKLYCVNGRNRLLDDVIVKPGNIYHSKLHLPANRFVGDTWQLYYTQDPYVSAKLVAEYKFACPNSHKYALYYVNMIGGIDFLLCTEASSETVTTKNTSITRYTDNNVRHDFGKFNYMKEFTTSWSIQTDMLYGNEKYTVNEQAALIQNLFQSPKVWLHDLENDIIYSVNITDSKMTNKTFMANGNKYFNYTINVEKSQVDNIIV